MKLRKKAYGDCNMVGRNIERLRLATDKEVYVIAKLLDVPIQALFDPDDETKKTAPARFSPGRSHFIL